LLFSAGRIEDGFVSRDTSADETARDDDEKERVSLDPSAVSATVPKNEEEFAYEENKITASCMAMTRAGALLCWGYENGEVCKI